jgi:hypothetical protein
MARPWTPDKMKEVDEGLRAERILTLSELRRRYGRRFTTIVERGKIIDGSEYYLVRGIVSDASPPPEQVITPEAFLMRRPKIAASRCAKEQPRDHA